MPKVKPRRAEYITCILCNTKEARKRLGFCESCATVRLNLPESPCITCGKLFNHHVAVRGGPRTGYYRKHCNECARALVINQRLNQTRNNKRWSEEEERKLLRLHNSGRRYSEIAKILKRTRAAVRGKIHEVFQSTRRIQYMNTRDVQYAIGIKRLDSVTKWFNQGVFDKAVRIHDRTWHIKYEDFIEWLEDRRYWMLWNVEDIVDSDLRKHAISVRERAEGYWMRVDDVVRMTSYSVPTIARSVQTGELPSTFMNHCSWFWVNDVRKWMETHDDLMYERRYKKPRPK